MFHSQHCINHAWDPSIPRDRRVMSSRSFWLCSEFEGSLITWDLSQNHQPNKSPCFRDNMMWWWNYKKIDWNLNCLDESVSIFRHVKHELSVPAAFLFYPKDYGNMFILGNFGIQGENPCIFILSLCVCPCTHAEDIGSITQPYTLSRQAAKEPWWSCLHYNLPLSSGVTGSWDYVQIFMWVLGIWT